ncbi:MAG: prepilin-type N-terminal cleavage/methylation domain-containing protein [Methyloprofundus sp.]|nr:prepilin-type N-terminal cleavage/methylation domain-containing protein [Methyloprofundus sp.]
MAFHTPNKINGFTLIELIVVLTIGVALAGIAVKSASDLAFVARYEQTSEMANRIKAAIIGNPGKYINGQPDISGYVADMGRTPEYLRDLLQAGYCKTAAGAYLEHKSEASCKLLNLTNIWDWANTPCLDGTSLTKTECVTNGSTWLGVDLDSTTNLKHGWNGPYLQTAKLADNNAALEDGWGNGTENENYGWQINNNLSIAVGDTFAIKSKGKDQIINADGCLIYEDDCAYEIQANEYTKIISAITVSINSDDTQSYRDNGYCDLAGYCSDPFFTDKASCEASNTWHPNCSDSTQLTKLGCEAALGTWGASLTNNAQCLFHSGTWSTSISTSPPSQEICMRIFYRKDAVIESLVSTGSKTINKDGTTQDTSFTFSSTGIHIPNGINAIEIYEYDGADCANGGLTYPTGHRIQHLTFAPYKTIDNLVW